MEKLIELLNEYEDWIVSWVKEYSEEFGVFVLNTEQMIEEEIIISKSFGFIKWLVDNDKIDFEKFKEKNWTHWMRNLNKWFSVIWEWMIDWEDYSDLESILMILSIQDNPIDFLISILK